ncbi:hypothetical protein HNV12_02570 [Methanococcoides sp. SA1]|nr:hypothetical protein [Methanococcoides sp. SA1]
MRKGVGKSPESIYRIQRYVNYFVWITLIGAGVFSFFEDRWTVLFVTSLVFLLTFLPSLFEKRYRIDIPVEFEILVVVFVYASLFLGEVGNFYLRFWWWDILLHGISAVGFGFVGFMILFILYKRGKVQARPMWIAIFSFCFAVAIGAVWEIFEFGMDSVFGMNMQKSGLVDTMWDLVVNGTGALLASTIGFLYLKGEDRFSFSKLMERFVRENPGLFREK